MTEENLGSMDSLDTSALSAPEFDLFAAMEFPIKDMFALRTRVHSSADTKAHFARQVEELPDPASTQSPEKILRRGIGHWILGQYEHSIDCLKRVKAQAVASYFCGLSMLAKGHYKDAKALFDSLTSQDKNSVEFRTGYLTSIERAEAWEDLKKELKSAPKSYAESADAAYFEGRLAEINRQPEEAIACFEKAVERDPQNRMALFRLAYQLDTRGMDEEAIAIYEKLIKMPPVDSNVAINLGVLYEDHGRYDKAIACFEAVYRSNPNHPRAKQYLKDAKSSTNMFYDEDQEKKEDKLQQILRVPITDFELSVRARNCLAKMEIQTLGDLVKKSEIELLAFKNFGETSLNEIKEILRAKGLRLGMTKEEGMQQATLAPTKLPEEASPEVLQKSVSELDLSVRSRRMVDLLGLRTMGELAAKTEKELLSTPNFGQTSLNEIKEKMRLFGIKLADSR